MNDKITVLNDDNFVEFVNSHEVVLVDFWATWCGPCRMLAPVIDELAQKYCDKIAFAKVDVDESPATAEAFDVNMIPTVIILKGGKEKERSMGYKNTQAFDEILMKY